ncbi:MAG: hypothetical protein KDJ88_20805 [Bauldia sp.]|nr:hypothetical protein [Bauldia sp.]
MHLRESEFEHTTDLFYEAAAAPELWPRALQALADSTRSISANLMPIRPGPDWVVTSPAARGVMEEFVAQGWLQINPYMRRGLELTRAGWKGLITERDMLTPDEIAADPYVNDVERPWGFGPKAGMVIASAAGGFLLPMTIERGISGGPFSPSEIRVVNRLMAILQPAARLALSVASRRRRRSPTALRRAGWTSP